MAIQVKYYICSIYKAQELAKRKTESAVELSLHVIPDFYDDEIRVWVFTLITSGPCTRKLDLEFSKVRGKMLTKCETKRGKNICTNVQRVLTLARNIVKRYIKLYTAWLYSQNRFICLRCLMINRLHKRNTFLPLFVIPLIQTWVVEVGL